MKTSAWHLWGVWRQAIAYGLPLISGTWLMLHGQAMLGHGLVAATVLWWAIHVFLPVAKTIVRECPGKEVLLTFDDGPHETLTPILLDLLQRHGVKAMFFVIGRKAAAHPDIIRRILAEGHLLGNHSQTHPSASFWASGPRRLWREVTACREVLFQITGEHTPWFRPPVGHRPLGLTPILQHFHYVDIGWSRRGFDGVQSRAEDVVRGLVRDLNGGEILLMHDSFPEILTVVEQVLAEIAAQGLAACNGISPPSLRARSRH